LQWAKALGFFFDEGRDEHSEAVEGFVYLGTDYFSGEYSKYKKYLPSDFNRGDEFVEDIQRNEKLQEVKSAKFKNLRTGLTAFAAVYKSHRQAAIDYGTELGYGKPTDEQLHFWSYYFFQIPNGAKSVLKNNGSWDFSHLKFNKLLPHPAGIASKCYKRLATWQYVKLKGVFSK